MTDCPHNPDDWWREGDMRYCLQCGEPLAEYLGDDYGWLHV